MDKRCYTCKAHKPTEEFGLNRKNGDGLQPYCRACGKEKDRRHYATNDDRKKKIRATNAATMEKNRQFIIDYLLAHPCVDCGESNPLYLDFDHVRGIKEHNVSTLLEASLHTLKAEIAKCEIRCVKCHRRRTAIQQKWKWVAPFL